MTTDETPVRPDAPDATDLHAPDSVAAWLVRLLKGIAVGIGFILPGLSGGVLAVIFKIYDPMIKFLANLRQRFWANVRYFIPVGIGGVIGVVLFSIVVAAAFGRYEAAFVTLFIGFVIGTFPSLYRQAGKRGRTPRDLLVMAAAAVGIFALMYLGGDSAWLQVQPSIPVWFGSGALIGLGVILPGMSPSNFLIYFGLYEKMAAGIKALDPATVIPLALGAIACVVLLAKLVEWALHRSYSTVFHLILGMVIGSSIAIFPTVVFPAFSPTGLAASGLSLGGSIAFAVALLVVGTVASLLFSKVEDRYSDQRESIESSAKG